MLVEVPDDLSIIEFAEICAAHGLHILSATDSPALVRLSRPEAAKHSRRKGDGAVPTTTGLALGLDLGGLFAGGASAEAAEVGNVDAILDQVSLNGWFAAASHSLSTDNVNDAEHALSYAADKWLGRKEVSAPGFDLPSKEWLLQAWDDYQNTPKREGETNEQ